MSERTYWVRECRGHWHVACEVGDLCLLPGSVTGHFTTKEQAQNTCNLLNEGRVSTGVTGSLVCMSEEEIVSDDDDIEC